MRFTSSKLTQGFSLTELSVSLSIIAMIAGSALSVALTSNLHANTVQTESKLNKIDEALAGFVALNHRLPCPADGTLSPTAAGFGLEGTPSASGCAGANFHSNTVYGGVVPTRSLQLPDEFMLDGWGRRISYAVDAPFTNNDITNSDCDGTTSSFCFIDTTEDNATITVLDASGTARTSHALYVLFSHGENGHGAFLKTGGTTRVNAYETGNPWRNGGFPGELENTHYSNNGEINTYNAIFVAKSFSRDEATHSDYFDDLVHFKTKSQLVKTAGTALGDTILYDSICRDTASIMATPVNDCTGAANESDCTNFASEINKRCL